MYKNEQHVAERGKQGTPSRPLTTSRCLEIAKEADVIPPSVSATLEKALQEAYRRIKAQPEVYIMSKDEYAVLNYFQGRFKNDRLYSQAVFRFWKNILPREGVSSSIEEMKPSMKEMPYMAPPGYLGPDSVSAVIQKRLQGTSYTLPLSLNQSKA